MAEHIMTKDAAISWIKWIQSNAQLFLYTIVAVLILRHLLLEAFKIPTSSMEPTLIGDPNCGDYILVQKLGLCFQEPQRWDVIVFRYPLNERKPFIKRLIGLPNEQITIQNGNIYSGDHIIRKPKHIQQILKYPLVQKGTLISQLDWNVESGEWVWLENSVQSNSFDKAWIRYGQGIFDFYTPQTDNWFYRRSRPGYTVGGNHRVGEIQLQFQALALDQGSLCAQIRSGFWRFLLTLATSANGPSKLTVYKGETEQPFQELSNPFALIPGTWYAISLSNFDEQIEVEINQSQIFAFDYAVPLQEAATSTYEAGVGLGTQHGKFQFADFQLFRDIYYISRKNFWAGSESWQVPPGHYFMLGDNSADSNDSCDWQKFQIVLHNGLTIEGDQFHLPEHQDEFYTFRDNYGRYQQISKSIMRDGITSHISAPFVSRQQIMGKAWLVI